MIDERILANCCIATAALIAVLVGLTLTLVNKMLEKTTRRWFVVLFAILTVYVICDLLSQITLMLPGCAPCTRIMIFLESASSSAAMPVLTVMLICSYGGTYLKSPLYYTVVALYMVYFALLIITQFTTEIYYITPDNEYVRGPYYAVLLVPPVLIMLVNLAALLVKRNCVEAKQFVAYLVYLLVPMTAMLIQILVYSIVFIVLGTALAAFYLMIVIQTDQMRQYVWQKEKIAQQRASIDVLQMRPHFIYNTMTSIYYLCEQDPKTAQQVTLDFTNYLRRNFYAIAEEGTVLFTEELEHTKAYLAVELVRFKDELIVSFDTPHTDFRLPPLTLQPIVENAVKHSVKSELDPTHINIITRKTENGSEVIVEDTGPGFAEVDNGEPHIALKNIVERLRMMCGGTLTISPHEGGGTRVTLMIPQK